MKLEPKDFKSSVITIYDSGVEIKKFSGKHYIYFGEKNNENVFHYITEDGKHHRIFGNYTVTVDEIN